MSSNPLTSQNSLVWHDRTVAEHLDRMNNWASQGYRTLSLSVNGDPSDPRYAAVLVKRAALISEHQVFPRTHDQLLQDIADQAKLGRGATIITATGPAASASYAACFQAMNIMPVVKLRLSSDDFASENDSRYVGGDRLLWLDVFGTADDVHFCGIWAGNPDGIAWSTRGWDTATAAPADVLPSDSMQQRFDALTANWARRGHVAVTPAGTYVDLFVDSVIGPWAARGGLTKDQFQDEIATQTKAGLRPLQVSAKGPAGAPLYAAVFASREDIDGRTFRTQGPVTIATIDNVMEDFLRKANLRGAGLAIARGSRLVYAKGYTFAEPSYPDLTPTTPFRQASVSKTFTGIAMWRLMQLNTAVTLDKTLQSVLNLTQPNGTPPADPRFGKITIQNLLESDSGIPQDLFYNSAAAAKAANASLPATAEQFMRYVAAHMLTGDPGDKANWAYGNVDYLFLSHILTTLQGAPSFQQALDQLLFQPLGLKNTHLSHSLLSAQVAGDAHHHMLAFDAAATWPLRPFEVKPTVRSADGRIVATHYGALDYEMFAGAGGISASVVDVARLGSMLSCRSNNPVLTSDQIDSLLLGVRTATATLTGPNAHGFYGFDSAKILGGNPPVYQYGKGGWLPGQGTSLVTTPGDFTYAIALNGNNDVGYKWYPGVSSAAEAQAWSGEDLFQTHFGMVSLTSVDLGAISGPFPVDFDFEQQVKASVSGSWLRAQGTPSKWRLA